MNELVVFNDPDDDEFEEEDIGPEYYLDSELTHNYWIFKAVAKGDAGLYLKLIYETSRVDVFRAFAYAMTLAKEKKKQEKRINNGRRY